VIGKLIKALEARYRIWDTVQFARRSPGRARKWLEVACDGDKRKTEWVAPLTVAEAIAIYEEVERREAA
jgi:hypothetical protein